MNNDLALEDVLLAIGISGICTGDYDIPYDEEWVENSCPIGTNIKKPEMQCGECWRRSFQMLKDEGKLNVQ